jgi:hypothetical protein
LLVPIGAIISIAAKVDGQALVGGQRDRRGLRHGPSSLPAATIGLGVFLAVVSSLFALFISAYFMRMQVADWVQLPAPKLLWFNTGVLILSSVALQYAQVAARRGRRQDVGDDGFSGGNSYNESDDAGVTRFVRLAFRRAVEKTGRVVVIGYGEPR